MFKDASIFETQKLKQVVNWTELFLDKHHTGDSMQEISPSFGRSALEHDAEKKVTINTINKKPEYFDVKLLHAHISNGLSSFVVSENILEQTEKETPPALLDSSILNSSLEVICPTQITKYDQEHQNKRQGSAWGEREVDDHKHSTGKNPNVQNSYIVCKGDESFSTTIDLHENLDYYFWAPLNDSSDEEWTDVVQSKSLKRPDTLAKTYTNPPCNTGLLKSDHKKTVDVSVLADGLPSARSASSVEKGTVAAENLAEIKERDHCKDFIWILKPDSSSGTSDNAESTIGQVTNGNIPFDPETQKDALCFLDFQSQKKGTVQKKESKLVHVTGMDKSFEENKCVGKEQANSSSNGKNCTGEQTGLELQPLKKNKSMLISNLYTNILLKPLGDTACKVSPGSFDLHNKDNYGCVEGGSVTPISIPKYKQDDINEYVSEDVTKSTVGPKSSSEEILIPRTKVVEKKKLFGYDKCLSDSHDHDSVLAQYYFYLNYLSWSKRLQLEEVNHSFSCEELHRFSQEENFSANYHFKNNNKDAEDADSDSGPSGMSRTEGRRTEAIKPQGGNSEEQESKPSFTNTCHTPLPHRALTDKRDPRCSKDKIVPEIRKISTNVANNKRHWERSGGTAGSSCTHGERKQRSRYVHRTISANENRRKDRNVSRSLPFSGKESRQQHGAAIQGDEERNVKSDADSSVLSWLLLPDELWLCIFSLLTHKDISQVSQVCHRFYQLAADDSFWKEIKLVNCHCLNDSWLVRIGSHHPQHVTLDHCHSENQRITEVGLRHFFQQCKGSLKELNIKNCTGPGLRGDTVLLHASTFCNLLTTVDISWTGATDSGLIDLVTAAISLQCLSANGCQITENAVAALAEQHGKSLRKLEIFGCYGVTAKCIKYVAMKCPDIKVLNIGRIPKVTEDCLEKVVNAMKKLTSLNITGLNVVKDCVVHFIAKKCPELEGLVLNSCSQVTDLSLLDISMYLPTIRYLDVSGCKEVTDVGVQALAERCHKLSYLDLSSTATSKRGVCLLANFCFSTLECVKISFCKAVTPDAAAKLCKNCKRLKILHLYGCQFMPDVQSLKKKNKTVEVFHDLAVPTAKLSSE